MRGSVFINYVGGVNRNDLEQQRQILSHASRLKKAKRNASLEKNSCPAPRSCAIYRKEGAPHCDHFCPCNVCAYLETNERRPAPGVTNDGAFTGSGFDPFHALPAAEVLGLHKIVEYVLQCYGAKIQPLQRALGCEPQTTKHLFVTAVANPEFFNALMAHGCADLEVHQTRVILDTPSPRVLFFRGESYKALSGKLNKGGQAIDVSTVLAILMLMGMDIAFGDAQPVLMHRRALRTMMSMPDQPGIRKPVHWLQHDQLVDFTTNYVSEELPAWYLAPGETLLTPFPMSRRKPLHYHSDSLESYEAMHLVPDGFRNLILQCHLSIEVQEIIKRIARVVGIFGNARNHTVESSEIDFATAYKAEHEFHACIDCLRRIKPTGKVHPGLLIGKQRVTIEHVVCLALVAFINCVFACMTYGPLFKAVRNSLQIALRDCEALQEYEACIAWAHSVEVWATSMYSESQSQLATDVIKHLSGEDRCGSTGMGLQMILQRFLWTEDMAAACEKALARAPQMEVEVSS